MMMILIITITMMILMMMMMMTRHVDKRFIEEVPRELQKLEEEKRCVSIDGLYKVFNTPVGPKVAVNDLQVTMYEGQIFCLLGHNGAGKTTAISMLCGMLPVSGRNNE